MVLKKDALIHLYPDRILELKKKDYVSLVKKSLSEDEAFNDITTKATISLNQSETASIISKEKGVLAGAEIAEEVFHQIDPSVQIELHKKDGDSFTKNKKLITIKGKVNSILSAERTALNFLAFLSGIASHAREISKILSPSGIKLLDTRKTVPMMRRLSKYAVAMGGGGNHRLDLSEMGLIKDNHIAACGSVSKAVQKFKKTHPNKNYEVEIENKTQLEEALGADARYILLDNMPPARLKSYTNIIRKHEKRIGEKIWIEASGGYNLSNTAKLTNSGIDFVSMGSITMQLSPIDFSLEIGSK